MEINAVEKTSRPVNRINGFTANDMLPEHTEQERMLEMEIARTLKLLEPVYQTVKDLRKLISDSVVTSVRNVSPAQAGFRAENREPENVSRITNAIEKSLKILNVLYDSMQGPATELSVTLRRISLNLQTQLGHRLLELKMMAPDGELSGSDAPAFCSQLLGMQLLLANDEINLESIRGRIS